VAYGTQAYGTTPYSGTGFLIVSTDPPIVSSAGGETVVATGVFAVGTYRIYLGPNGDDTDNPCYSGIPGRGLDILCEDGATMTFVVPPADAGLQKLAAIRVTDSLGAGGDIEVAERPWYGKLFRARKHHPPWAAVGARSLRMERRL